MIRSSRGVFAITLMALIIGLGFPDPALAAQRKPKAGTADPTLSIQGKQKKKLAKVKRKTNRKKRSTGA